MNFILFLPLVIARASKDSRSQEKYDTGSCQKCSQFNIIHLDKSRSQISTICMIEEFEVYEYEV